MILSTPAFREIKRQIPESKLFVLSGRKNHAVIQNNPNLDKIYIYRKIPSSLLKLIYRLRSAEYDFLVDPRDHFSRESKIFSRIIKAKTKIGYNPPGENNFDISVPDHEKNFNLHFVERTFNALKPLGIDMPLKTPLPELHPGKMELDYASKFLRSLPKKKNIIFNISAGRPERRRSDTLWQKSINMFNQKDFNKILIFGPEDVKKTAEYSERCSELNIFHSESIMQAAALVKLSDLAVSADTSIVHIAAAFDKPIAALYFNYPKNYNKFYPLSSLSKSLLPPQGKVSINDIPPEHVNKAVDELIDKICLPL